ncbi:MAG: SigB/SigF/SigG family RNA polymerase sigma factor [Bacillota bacterium]|nr:SigB/SigF/SigG family RNA polymerase sigma factor [Bacillota bacterium]
MSRNKKIKNYELFLEYSKNRDTETRDKIFEEYMYIAEILSKKYTNKGVDYDDIYQIACIGLLYAIDRFDIERGFEFSSFATPTILGEIKKYFRDKTWTMKIPRRIQELSKKVNSAKVYLMQKNQEVPTPAEIGEYLRCTEEEVLEAMEASKAYNPKSLDLKYETGSEDNNISLMDIVGEKDDSFKNIEDKDFIKNVMKKLNKLERTIIEKRYLYDDKTQEQLGEELDISQVTVSRIEKRIFEKFKIEYKRSN